MARHELAQKLLEGSAAWNRWRKESKATTNNANELDLSGVILDLENARSIYSRQWDGAYLPEIDLHNVDLSGANLECVYFGGANLRGANLTGANLRCSGLDGVDFTDANLDNVDFAYTDFSNNVLHSIDLSTAKGLDTLRHLGPSCISTETLRRSKGCLPIAFLRGCGLSDWEIEAAKLHAPQLDNQTIGEIIYHIHDVRVGRPIQISPIFISYSHADFEFVGVIETHLTDHGIRFWRDVHDSTAGRLETQIDRAIRKNPIVLLVLSENSVKSDWVQHEARLARDLEVKSGRDVLCPIALDSSWKDCRWPARLREQIQEYNVLDFSNWKDEPKFRSVFKRLITGLGAFYAPSGGTNT